MLRNFSATDLLREDSQLASIQISDENSGHSKVSGNLNILRRISRSVLIVVLGLWSEVMDLNHSASQAPHFFL